jgi:hypothetical protein
MEQQLQMNARMKVLSKLLLFSVIVRPKSVLENDIGSSRTRPLDFLFEAAVKTTQRIFESTNERISGIVLTNAILLIGHRCEDAALRAYKLGG